MENRKEKRIKVAIIGVGNCASSLVQGVQYYTNNPAALGLMYRTIGGYEVPDIEFVAAFDVDSRKIGKDLSQAIFSEPNNTKKFSEVAKSGVIVKPGHRVDSVAEHMMEYYSVSDEQLFLDDYVKILKESGADVLINYLPVGSYMDSRWYANVALAAGVDFINAIPEFICSEREWIKEFEDSGLRCVGDDIKSQVGATILHRTIARLVTDRGHTIDNTYQLNIGGNGDFLNMTAENRLESKRKSKTQAVLSILSDKNIGVKIGPSDYVPHLKDNKIAYINVKGKQFGGVPYEIDVKLSVEDSPNSAGVMVDVIRGVRLAKDRGIVGYLDFGSAYFKSPKVQYSDDESKRVTERFYGLQEPIKPE